MGGGGRAEGEGEGEGEEEKGMKQGWIQANATDAGVSVKKICLNYFWSASSKSEIIH